ncbi:hypothetical protein [Actinomadura sp. 7K507]|uniref:hypothetical protein n=1 Tax=Actinomadura sp. 7K507 TaxID=2530365 RepID=UPI00104DB9D7|nr:hypothetical protein [Actinomadura sp. 7K507]TDC73820.1 hypothetical protein E1285_44220 [Actinomadura sp. 7K507]
MSEQTKGDDYVRLPKNWLLTVMTLITVGLLVSLVVSLRSATDEALAATAMALAVISFCGQLALTAVNYAVGIRQEQRASQLHRETLEAILSLRSGIESNLSATNILSDRFNSEFQTILDYALAESARGARSEREVQLIENIGTDLREKALEAAVSLQDSARSRLAATAVRLLHESPDTASNSVAYSRGVISWVREGRTEHCTAYTKVNESDISITELTAIAEQVRRDHEARTAGTVPGLCYVILSSKPDIFDGIDPNFIAGACVTWIERFGLDLAGANQP